MVLTHLLQLLQVDHAFRLVLRAVFCSCWLQFCVCVLCCAQTAVLACAAVALLCPALSSDAACCKSCSSRHMAGQLADRHCVISCLSLGRFVSHEPCFFLDKASCTQADNPACVTDGSRCHAGSCGRWLLVLRAYMKGALVFSSDPAGCTLWVLWVGLCPYPLQ